MVKRMKHQTNLVKRKPSGIYYFRARVPLALVETLGKDVIFDSLGTTDKGTAVRLAAERRHQLQQELARHQREAPPIQSLTGKRDFLSDDEIQLICDAYKAERLQQDEVMRIEGMSPSSSEMHREIFEQHLEMLRPVVARGESNYVGSPLGDHLKKLEIALNPDSPSYKALAYKFLLAEFDVTEKILGRQDGKSIPTPAPVKHSIGLDDLVDYWAKHRHADAITKEAFQSTVDEFKQQFPGLAATLVKKQHVIEYRNKLNEDGAAPATIDKKLSFLKAIFSVAAADDIVEFNPVTGVRPPENKRATKKRIPFSIDDLNTLFKSPVFAAGERPRGGGGEAAYWLPLLALYGGARLEELCQLKASDIKEHKGLGFYYKVTDEEGRRVKTQTARRSIPVHSQLIQLGFLDYVVAIRKAKADFLFPELVPDTKGKRSGNWSKWFTRYRRSVGLKDDRTVFHSFRHGFLDECRERKVDKEYRDVLVGHSSGEVSEDYGAENYPLTPLFDAVARIRYDGLEISHLFPK
jgi:integrase